MDVAIDRHLKRFSTQDIGEQIVFLDYEELDAIIYLK